MFGINPNQISWMILFIVTITSAIAYLPQIIKLIKTRESDDISVISWVIWLGQYTLMLIYSIIFTVDIWLCLAYFIEFIACLTILLLVIKLKKVKR
ncbi:MAG: PQ-loop repeat-containing protein [Oscillospiraceae bacterium]|nr:PQ-loop repeat-containing protein [Oscillospiraceae bacterium]